MIHSDCMCNIKACGELNKYIPFYGSIWSCNISFCSHALFTGDFLSDLTLELTLDVSYHKHIILSSQSHCFSFLSFQLFCYSLRNLPSVTSISAYIPRTSLVVLFEPCTVSKAETLQSDTYWPLNESVDEPARHSCAANPPPCCPWLPLSIFRQMPRSKIALTLVRCAKALNI